MGNDSVTTFDIEQQSMQPNWTNQAVQVNICQFGHQSKPKISKARTPTCTFVTDIYAV